ncbi:hypothetical protein [Spirosoma foliorum]|uniref:Uncharacterized protein n=1 Tax=Spirosoma foliorum TaxID=2710596 RepID=A0A7G5GWT2_9BACT|nr:hypothetical protein [Spirosoma foliorum]QMW03324.1 hypothetical protein H3H32_36645 [Spirosoma foliorum]
MFKVLVNKTNNSQQKQFIIPKNQGYNCESWIVITIKGNQEFLMERFWQMPNIKEEEWEWKTNYAFPSALMTDFLRSDYNLDASSE